MRGGRFRRALAGVALVGTGRVDAAAGRVLDVAGQGAHGGAVAGVGRGGAGRQQVAERVDGRVDLAAAGALVPVPPRPAAAFGRGAEGAAVQHRRRGLRSARPGQAQHGAEVLRRGVGAARPQPARGLAVHRLPGREVVRHGAPRDAGPHQVAGPVEQLTQRVGASPGVLAQRHQVGRHQRPLLVGHVGRVRLAGGGRFHPASLSASADWVHNTL